MRTKIDYGIDLGTSNSSIARMVDGKPQIIFNATTYIEFKRTMGTATTYPKNGTYGRDLTSEELSAEVLKKLKSFVMDEDLSVAVITVPATFTVHQNKATVKAARLAGFKQVRLLQEPIAAATAYGLTAEETDGYWLVFNFGGGMFDVTLIRVEYGVMIVRDTAGDNLLGGKDLDEAIVDKIIIPDLQKKYAIDSILDARNELKRLAEQAKIQMSFQEAYHILSDPEDFPYVDIAVTQKDMERVLSPVFQKAIDITKDLLKRNHLKGSDLDELILVGGPTHSPILRRMLREQITEKINTSIDPMTAVVQGAAIYASGVDIEDIAMDDNADICLDIQYDSYSLEPEALVLVRVSQEKSRGTLPDKIYAEIKRSDGGWSSEPKQINSEKPVLFEVQLEKKNGNAFEIIVRDEGGNRIPCSPQKITMLQGIEPPYPVLAYNIGITKYFKDEEDELFFPIKGLEKNKAIPESKLTGVITGLRTRSEIRCGNADDKIRIPIYQGDYYATGSRLELNHWICDVIITGKNIPENLPEGSVMDIVIKIDRSFNMYFNAYFPALNYFATTEIEIQPIQAPSAESLKEDLAKARQRTEKAEATDLVRRVSELEEQWECGKGSPNGRMKIRKVLCQIMLDLIRIEKKREWTKLVAKMNWAYSRLKNFLREIENSGRLNDMLDDVPDDIDRRIRLIIAEGNTKEAQKVIEEIKGFLFSHGDGERIMIEVLHHCNKNFDTVDWKNPALARELVDKGLKLLLSKDIGAVNKIVRQLVQLLPRDINDDNLFRNNVM